MLSNWEWEVGSPLELSYRVCERDEVVMFGSSTPQGQAALVLSVGCVGYQWVLELPSVLSKGTSGLRMLVADVLTLRHLQSHQLFLWVLVSKSKKQWRELYIWETLSFKFLLELSTVGKVQLR